MTFEIQKGMNQTFTLFSVLISFLVFGMSSACLAQKEEKQILMHAEVYKGDTILVQYMPFVNIVAERKFQSKAARKRFNRLQYNVKKMYPYAKLAGELLKKYEAELAGVDSERARKKYYKMIEDELKEEFDGDIRKMSTSQGRILIKLIDRETGNTSYEIVQEFRGNVSAFFWQSLSRMFGQDLKSDYDPDDPDDPDGADREIESIVQMIEAGII